MLELRAALVLCLATALTGSVTAASAAKGSDSRPPAKDSIVTDHIAEVDGPIITLSAPDGRTWAVWSYRSSHEFDIAISSRGEGSATWSGPVFFGRGNGSDELDPALAVDSRGSIYIAFATANPPRIAVATLRAGSTAWSEPVIVSGPEAASSPALLLVGDRPIVAYQTARGIQMIDLATLGGGNQIWLTDGPDPISGIKGPSVPAGGPQTDKSNSPTP